MSIVVVLVVLFGLTLVYFRHREKQQLQAEANRRLQELQVINAAKEAHEKTISYACHQLRLVLYRACNSVQDAAQCTRAPGRPLGILSRLNDRNPLQAVLGSISFLRDQFDESSACFEDIAAITVAATDMARVVSDLSDWVKVSEGQLKLQRRPELVTSLLNDLVSALLVQSSLAL